MHGHVGAENAIDHLFAHRAELVLRHLAQQVRVRLADEQLEGRRDVEVLLHAPVVVRERQVVAHGDVEDVVASVVAEVVDDRAQEGGEHAEVVEVLVEADVAEEAHQGLGHVGGVELVVVGDRAVHRLRPPQEALRLARADAELLEEVPGSQRLPAGELERSPARQPGEGEGVEAPPRETLEQHPQLRDLAAPEVPHREPVRRQQVLAGASGGTSRWRRRTASMQSWAPGRELLPEHGVHLGVLVVPVVARLRQQCARHGRPRVPGLQAVAEEVQLAMAAPRDVVQPRDDAQRNVQHRGRRPGQSQLLLHIGGVGEL
mmetsp:Transcript_48023/g.126819  ORF Transcript_48023/g.126819 Transcript_48023/m.126819 type:complete len:317 (-) Transcript_48023:10-960(-)